MFSFQNVYVPYLLNNVIGKALKVENNRLTNHMGLTFEICTSGDSSGVGYWKLNTSLLNKNNFCKQLKGHIREELTKIIDPFNKWEHLKIRIFLFV